MENTSVILEINISAIEGQKMPEEAELLEKIMSHLYDHIIDGAAVVDAVHIINVNGKPTLEE